MAVERLLAWLRKRAPEECEAQRVPWLMSGLSSSDMVERYYARRHLVGVIYNNHKDYSPDDVIAVLNALGQQNDLKDVPWILNVLVFLLRSWAGFRIEPEIVTAARICDQKLRERYEPGYLAHTLLHPSAASGSADTLLRPAQGGSGAEPDTLLRAVTGDETTREPKT